MPQKTLWQLSRALLWAHFRRCKIVPGYTVCEHEGGGRYYVAVLFEDPNYREG